MYCGTVRANGAAAAAAGLPQKSLVASLQLQHTVYSTYSELVGHLQFTRQKTDRSLRRRKRKENN